jgi:hypothetical protein
VDLRPHRGVQRPQDLAALELLGGDGDPHRAPGLLHRLDVLFGQIAALVEHRKAHDPEIDLDVTHLLDFQNPA